MTQQFRCKEERIYPGDEIFAIGEMGVIPPHDQSHDADGNPTYAEELDVDSDEDQGDDVTDSDGSGKDEALGGVTKLFDRFDEEDEEAALAAGQKRTHQVLSNVRLLSARPVEELLTMMTQGSKALAILGLGGSAIAGFFVWVRLGG